MCGHRHVVIINYVKIFSKNAHSLGAKLVFQLHSLTMVVACTNGACQDVKHFITIFYQLM